MHNNFLDKKRRNLRLQPDQVELVLPEHFQASYPKFISLLKFYYEFQNEEKATELLHHLFATRDITETDIELLSYIEDELLLGDSYFESFATGDAAKRAAANFSSTLFRAKGTLFAIQWFFRSFYNLDAEVTQTKENVFIVGEEASTIGVNSLRYLTDDKLYQTFAYLVRTEVPVTKWGELFKLFVHPAGMYLGSALLVQDKVLESLLSEDSDEVVETRTTPSYLYQNNTGSSEEGVTFTINLLGTNVPNDTGIFSWYIENLTTDSSDFAFSGDFPDEDNKRQVLMADDGGTVKASITIPTVLDVDETEGTEAFRVYFEDPEGREIPNVLSMNVPYLLVSLTDVVSSYVINPIVGDSEVDEGDLITLRITGTDVPNNGNTNVVVRTYATGSAAQGTDSADEDDFISFPTTDTTVPITNSAGTFTLQTKVDNHSPAEGVERVSFGVLTPSGIVKDSCFVDINNVTPTFNFGNPDDITYDLLVTEGDDIVVRLQVDATTVGETIEYTINNGGDTRVQTTSGEFEITGTDANYTLSGTSITDTFDSANMTYSMNTLAIGDGGSFGPDQLSDTKVIQLRSQDATFTVTVDEVGLTEGETATFTISGTNIQDGVSAKYYVAHGTTDAGDFSVTPPSTVGLADDLTFTSNQATQALTFASNTDTDDNADESFTFTVIDLDDNVVATLPYTIRGVSTYSITTPAGVTEQNQEVVAQFETDNADIKTAGQAYYYVEGANITSSDFTSGYASVSSRSTFTVDGTTGIGQITLDTRQDQRREGAETFKIYVSAGASDGVVASTGDISISDTSLPVYTITMADITEGDTLSCVVTPDTNNTGSEDVYVTFSVTSGAVTFGDATPLPQTLSAISGAKTFTTTTSVNSIYYSGGSTVQADVRVGSYTGTSIGTVTATVDNAAPVYTLNTSPLSADSANEGDTIRFAFGGTNVESGFYNWHLSNIAGSYLPSDFVSGNKITSGSNVIYFSTSYDLSLIQVGDEIRGQEAGLAFDSEATVTFVSNTGTATSHYITMSENASATYNTGNKIYFAAPEVWENYGDANTNPATDDGKPYGQFTHTSGSTSTFDLIVTDTNDVADPSTFSQTMRVYDGTPALSTGSLLKSKTFTIYDGDVDPTPNVQRGTLTDPDTFGSIMRGTDAICEIRFLSDGSIEVGEERNFPPNSQFFTYTDFGDWVDDTDPANFDPAEFEIQATKSSETITLIGYTIGNFGVWETLDNNQSWRVDAILPPGQNATSSVNVEIDFQIREISNTSNSVSFTVELNASAINIDR